MPNDEPTITVNVKSANADDSSSAITDSEWWSNLWAVGIVGIGVGWLLGLSVSPVVANVVAVIIAAAAALVATMGGWEKNEDTSANSEKAGNKPEVDTTNQPDKSNDATVADNPQQKSKDKPTTSLRLPRIITPWPFACLMIGVFFGSIFGLSARNHSFFGSDLSYEVKKWTDQGLPKDEVVRRLFEREHPYTPYAQPWLWMTYTQPITPSSSITTPQITVSTPLSAEIATWANLGLDRTEVVSRFFELKYPPSNTISSTTSGEKSTSELSSNVDKNAGLNAGNNNAQTNSDACAYFRNNSWDKLKKNLEIEDELNKLTNDKIAQNNLLDKIFKSLSICP